MALPSDITLATAPFTLSWTGTNLDSAVGSFEISQAEGDFATLSVVIFNPRVGLLAGNLWATLSYNGTPIFYGRLVGLPSDMQGETVQLTFIAKPDDYDAQKAALAATLRVAPWWDPVFVSPDQLADPDQVLQSRTALWHTDRVTHQVTTSDIITGEAGTIEIPIVDYTSVKVTLGDQPAESIACRAEIRWGQAAKGSVDLTQAIWAKFDAAHSTNGPCVTSYTGGGLASSWPKTGSSIGAGWTVGDSFAERGDGGAIPTTMLTVECGRGGFEGNTGVKPTGSLLANHWGADIEVVDADGSAIPAGATIYDNGDGAGVQIGDPGTTYTSTLSKGYTPVAPNYYKVDPEYVGEPSYAGFPLWSVFAGLKCNYDVSRDRQEIVTFVMSADVQPVISARTDTQLSFDLSGQVDQPIDPPATDDTGNPVGGAQLPIRDVRRSSYMLTDRGHQSFQHMMLRARAHLLASARAVKVSFETTFDLGLTLSLRHSATIVDPRLPGGQATGKVTSLVIGLDGSDGRPKAAVTLSCTIGHAIEAAPHVSNPDYGPYEYTVPPTDGAPVFASAPGTVADLITGDVSYITYDNVVPDDDGVDLSLLDATTAVLDLVVTNGSQDQMSAMIGQAFADTNEAITTLNNMPTKVALTLKPLTRSTPFITNFPVDVGGLYVPKTIDLEAASA